MVVVVFVNKNDASVQFLGKALITLLDRKYFVFSREPSEYPQCLINKTMAKLKEIMQHVEGERVIVSFGCRVFPNNMKQIEYIANKHKGNVVLLKKLHGSKTWTDKDGKLAFENERIADCGIFLLNKEDILATEQLNFNSFIKELLLKEQLSAAYVNFWIFSNRNENQNTRRN